MIQVLERAADVLKVLAAGDASLAAMTEQTGVRKTTLCNILRTLQDLGYVGRTADGRYCIGQGLVNLATSAKREDPVATLGRPIAERLAGSIGEEVVVAVLRGGQRFNVVHIHADADVVVSERAVKQGCLYTTATGPVLLSHATPAEVKQVLARHGLPGKEWDNLTTVAALEAKLAGTRQLSMYERFNGSGQIRMIAIPVRAGSEVVCALGVSAVESRCTREHLQVIHTKLARAGAQLGRAVAGGVSEAA